MSFIKCMLLIKYKSHMQLKHCTNQPQRSSILSEASKYTAMWRATPWCQEKCSIGNHSQMPHFPWHLLKVSVYREPKIMEQLPACWELLWAPISGNPRARKMKGWCGKCSMSNWSQSHSSCGALWRSWEVGSRHKRGPTHTMGSNKFYILHPKNQTACHAHLVWQDAESWDPEQYPIMQSYWHLLVTS